MQAVDGAEASLLHRAAGGDAGAWGSLLAQHEKRLAGFASFRLDPRLRGRVDPADVLQEAFILATARRAQFFEQSAQPLFLWLRWLVGNVLLELHRHHLGARMRDARREAASERPFDGGEESTHVALVAQLSGGLTGPSTAAGRGEITARLNEALGRMDATDREVLALRHFEQLTNAEAAQVLGIKERAAAKRYLRALQRLRDVLSEMPEGLTSLKP